MSKKSRVRGRTTMAAPANASRAKEVTNSRHGSAYYCIENRRAKPALWYFNRTPLLTVNSHGCCFHTCKLKDHYSVYKHNDTLCISPRMTVDGGAYTVYTDGKKSTFKHQKSRELAEPTETCEVQNCSHEFCSCYLIYAALVDSPMAQVKESSLKELKQLNCTAQNLISNESVTGVLHNGTSGKGNIAVALTISLLLVVLVSGGFFCKSKVSCVKERLRGRDGRRGDSHSAAGDSDTEAEVFV